MVDIRVSSYLKEELAWAVDKWLRVISIIMLFTKTVRLLKKELSILNLKQCCIHCNVALSNIF